MAAKKYFGVKQITALTVDITADGYLELCQPNNDEDVKFFLSPAQSESLARYIRDNQKELRSSWGAGTTGDK